jgi:hypothetical protein
MYTEKQAEMFREELDCYQGEGWTPGPENFVSGFQAEDQNAARAWYADHVGGGSRSMSLSEAVRWGEAPDYMLDDMDF